MEKDGGKRINVFVSTMCENRQSHWLGDRFQGGGERGGRLASAWIGNNTCDVCLRAANPRVCLQEKDSVKSTNKTCRQLIYHLTPHSKWSKQSVPRRKSQAW